MSRRRAGALQATARTACDAAFIVGAEFPGSCTTRTWKTAPTLRGSSPGRRDGASSSRRGIPHRDPVRPAIGRGRLRRRRTPLPSVRNLGWDWLARRCEGQQFVEAGRIGPLDRAIAAKYDAGDAWPVAAAAIVGSGSTVC
jgi:hypothetical protein